MVYLRTYGMLFNKGRTTIIEHLRHIFQEGELTENEVCLNSRHTTKYCALKGKTQTKDVTNTKNIYGLIKGIAVRERISRINPSY